MAKKQEVSLEIPKIEKVSKEDQKKGKIDKIKQEESRVLKALTINNYENLVSNCYTELDTNIDMVLQDISYGFIAEGKGGTGKTFRIVNRCSKEKGEDGFAYADSFTTPTALYVWMYENREKEILILDDCAGLMDNPKILAMLKGALWHLPDGKTRVINYMSTKPPKDEYDEPLPRSFEVKSRIIIITNYLNDDNPHVKAILSRINKVSVDVPRKELIDILKEIVKNKYGELSLQERNEALTYLIDNTTTFTEELNIRTLLRIMDYKIWAKRNKKEDAWKTLSLKLLKRDDKIAFVEKLIQDESISTEEEKINEFIKQTGSSRATYFRLKKSIKSRKKSEGEETKKLEEVQVATQT